MKRTLSLTVLAALALAPAAPALSQTQSVEITAASLAREADGTPTVLDLGRGGTIYTLDAGLDYSRLRIKTSRGVVSMSTAVLSPPVRGKLLLGSFKDLSAIGFGFPPGTGSAFPADGTVMEIKCSATVSVCTCQGRRDCSDLSKTGRCGEVAVCGEGKGTNQTGWGCTCTTR